VIQKDNPMMTKVESMHGLNVFLIVVQNVISTNTNYKVLNGRIEEKKKILLDFYRKMVHIEYKSNEKKRKKPAIEAADFF
jgi:hypothetical protein